MNNDGLSWGEFNFDDLYQELLASDTSTRRDAKAVLRSTAKEIMKASQQMAPLDEGDLEEAHRIDTVRLNEDFIELEISVGGIVNGVDVDEYATIMHEGLAPFGSGTAGEVQQYIGKTGRLSSSFLKNASNPSDRQVGGKFLERAVAIFEKPLMSRLSAILTGEK